VEPTTGPEDCDEFTTIPVSCAKCGLPLYHGKTVRVAVLPDDPEDDDPLGAGPVHYVWYCVYCAPRDLDKRRDLEEV